MDNSLRNKLFDLQKIISPVEKKETNPFYNSKYIDINELLALLKPLLQERDLYVLQPGRIIDGKSCIGTCIIDKETGESVESFLEIPSGIDAQKIGAACTYLRRHSLKGLLALEEVDDDGNSTLANPPKSKGETSTVAYQKKEMPLEDVAAFMEPDPQTGEIHDQNQAHRAPTGKMCPKCEQVMKLVPAGTSKAGKPFKAFYSCTRECNTTLPAYA